MEKEKITLISTTEAIAVASEYGVTIKNRDSLMYWCNNYPIGARKIGGTWKIDKEIFIDYLKGDTAYKEAEDINKAINK